MTRYPEDIRAEVLLTHFPLGNLRMAFRGLHKRNAYNDIVDVDHDGVGGDGKPIIGLARNSLYHSLPEYMFHPIDRFSDGNMAHRSEDDPFMVEVEQQQQEKERASRFFAPLDLQLLLLSADCREQMRPYTDRNSVLINILADELTDGQRANRFIAATMPFLPYCKHIRGDKTLLTLMLRKVFADEGIAITQQLQDKLHIDMEPRYDDGLDSRLGDDFLGNAYDEEVETYNIHYWDPNRCDEHFMSFLNETDCYRRFIEDYFMALEQTLVFDITTDDDPLMLTTDDNYNYLDYNTNL